MVQEYIDTVEKMAGGLAVTDPARVAGDHTARRDDPRMVYSRRGAGRLARIGLTHHRTGYFASRSAAMVRCAEVVIATFFNSILRSSTGRWCVWDTASPAQVLEARYEGADAALRRALGEAIGSAELRVLAGLARTAALAACDELAGRPLFAGHAALP